MRIAVCQAPAELDPGSANWRSFAAAVRGEQAQLLLLNEMPFGRWVAGERRSSAPDDADSRLEHSRRLHQDGIARLGELGAATVCGTAPVADQGRSTNQAFVWHRKSGVTMLHSKQFFPNEPGYYEQEWFERGDTHFNVHETGGARAGFLICTEVMFNERARHYGRAGAHLILVPRATPPQSTRRWRTALSMAAIVSGCYVASSNRGGSDSAGQEFGGHGWIIDPNGDVIAETSAEHPVAGAAIDLDRVVRAQTEYPCYVPDLDRP